MSRARITVLARRKFVITTRSDDGAGMSSIVNAPLGDCVDIALRMLANQPQPDPIVAALAHQEAPC